MRDTRLRNPTLSDALQIYVLGYTFWRAAARSLFAVFMDDICRGEMPAHLQNANDGDNGDKSVLQHRGFRCKRQDQCYLNS